MPYASAQISSCLAVRSGKIVNTERFYCFLTFSNGPSTYLAKASHTG